MSARLRATGDVVEASEINLTRDACLRASSAVLRTTNPPRPLPSNADSSRLFPELLEHIAQPTQRSRPIRLQTRSVRVRECSRQNYRRTQSR